MLQSTELEIKLSETRTELRALQAGPPADDATEEVRAAYDVKIDDGMKSLDDLETQKRTALKAEEVAQERALKLVNVEQRVGAGDMPNIPTEIREYMGVEARCEMAPFLRNGLVPGAHVDGAEAELRSIFGIDEPGVVPWGLFLEPKRLQEIRQEQRQSMSQQGEDRQLVKDASLRAAFSPGSTIMSMQDAVIQDVFGASTASFLGTRFSSAPVGDSLQFVLTSGSAGITADATDRAQAGTLAAVTLTPKALRASYLINKSDLMRVRGLESALRTDMPRAIADVLDFAVINGAASGSLSNGIIHSAGTVSAATVEVTFGSGISTITAGIDGKFARSLKELKVVLSPPAIRKFSELIASNTAITLVDYLMMQSGGVMTTSNMPILTPFPAIVCKTGPGMLGNVAAKMWGGGIQIIRDEQSKAPGNQLVLTANAYYDFAVLRTDGFSIVSFKLA